MKIITRTTAIPMLITTHNLLGKSKNSVHREASSTNSRGREISLTSTVSLGYSTWNMFETHSTKL